MLKFLRYQQLFLTVAVPFLIPGIIRESCSVCIPTSDFLNYSYLSESKVIGIFEGPRNTSLDENIIISLIFLNKKHLIIVIVNLFKS